MITKGIVEKIIDKYTIRVRMPFYNRIASAPKATPTDDLYSATMCTLPNCNMNLQVGDIVFIGFEDHDISKPIILGQLCRETKSSRNASIIADTLEIKIDTHLSADTYIGDVQPSEIECLKGINKNLQFQLNILEERIAKLEEKLVNGDN